MAGDEKYLTKELRRAVGYGRVSTPGQRDNESTQNQEEAYNSYCEFHKLERRFLLVTPGKMAPKRCATDVFIA